MLFLTLDCGRQVMLDAFDYSRTYAGLPWEQLAEDFDWWPTPGSKARRPGCCRRPGPPGGFL